MFLRLKASSHLDVTHANVSGVDDGEVEDDGFSIVRKIVQIQVGQFSHLLLLLRNVQPRSGVGNDQNNDEFSFVSRLVPARNSANITIGRAQAISRRV